MEPLKADDVDRCSTFEDENELILPFPTLSGGCWLVEWNGFTRKKKGSRKE